MDCFEVRYLAAFICSTLNNQPMGFYVQVGQSSFNRRFRVCDCTGQSLEVLPIVQYRYNEGGVLRCRMWQS